MRWTVVLSSLIVLAVGAGCPSVPEEKSPFPLKLSPESTAAEAATARFLALDGATVGDIHYVDSRHERLPSGQVRITVNLRSARDRDAWVDWKAVFFDGRNFQVEETEWHADLFPRGETKTLSAQSIRKDVEKFTLMFRRAPGEAAEEEGESS